MFRVARRANRMIPRATIHVTSMELVTGRGPTENTVVAAGGKPSGWASCAEAAVVVFVALMAGVSAARPGRASRNKMSAKNTDLINKEKRRLPERRPFHKVFLISCF